MTRTTLTTVLAAATLCMLAPASAIAAGGAPSDGPTLDTDSIERSEGAWRGHTYERLDRAKGFTAEEAAEACEAEGMDLAAIGSAAELVGTHRWLFAGGYEGGDGEYDGPRGYWIGHVAIPLQPDEGPAIQFVIAPWGGGTEQSLNVRPEDERYGAVCETEDYFEPYPERSFSFEEAREVCARAHALLPTYATDRGERELAGRGFVGAWAMAPEPLQGAALHRWQLGVGWVNTTEAPIEIDGERVGWMPPAEGRAVCEWPERDSLYGTIDDPRLR
jgi:hypothetical protein